MQAIEVFGVFFDIGLRVRANRLIIYSFLGIA